MIVSSQIKGFLITLFTVFCISAFAQDTTQYVVPGLYRMPAVENIAVDNKLNAGGAVREDLHKFMGFESTTPRYLSLPYDVFIKANINNFFVDTGFLLLLILPIIFLLPSKRRLAETNFFVLNHFIMIMLLLLLLIISIPNAYFSKNKLNTPEEALTHLSQNNEPGFLSGLSYQINKFTVSAYAPFHSYVASEESNITYILMLAILGICIFILLNRLKEHTKMMKAVILSMVVYGFLWWMFGAGAAWYGILLFCVPYIFLVKGISNASLLNKGFKEPKSFIKYGSLLSICLIWVLMGFVCRSSGYNPSTEERATRLYIPAVTQYQVGNLSEKELMGMIFPTYYEIQELVNREDTSGVFRVGTALNYFIKKNDYRVRGDTFIEIFEELIQIYQDKNLVIKKLKEAGYRYIIVDLTVPAYDLTPDKSLTKKYVNLLNTLYKNSNVELLLTDRQLKSKKTNKIINAVFEDQGEMVNKGRVALFEIK